jgi:hypothetical protein
MTIHRLAYGVAFALTLGLITGKAYAADFAAADATWRPVLQNGVGFSDVNTDGTSTGGREVVGNASAPAVYMTTDGVNVFIRIRVDDKPTDNGGILNQFAWGILIDVDGNTTAYDYSLMINAKNNVAAIEFADNTIKSGGSKDQAEGTVVLQSEALNYAAGGNVRITKAPTTFSSDDDYFIDFAFPVAKIAPITTSTPIRIWAGTSSSGRQLDDDLAGVTGNTANSFAQAISDTTSFANPPPLDTDGDGVPDAVEIALGTNPNSVDTDGDGINDNIELSASGSTGPFIPIDTDLDGTIDAKDLDSDNDCATDQAEGTGGYRNASATPNANCGGGTPVCNITTGVCVASVPPDADGDGVPDSVETALGTNPNAKDTDGDGIPDNVELSASGGAGPFTAIDTDGDGVIDAKDLDSDNDCATDQAEGTSLYRTAATDANANCSGTTPVCQKTTGTCVAPKPTDTDGDGVPDVDETRLGTDPTKADTDGDGIPDNVELSVSGGAGPFLPIDTDGDGVIDAKDLDSDNDCATDQVEGTTTYRTPSSTPDTSCTGGAKCDVTKGVCIGGGADAGRDGSIDTPNTDSTPADLGSLEGGGISCSLGVNGGSAPQTMGWLFAAAAIGRILRRKKHAA